MIGRGWAAVNVLALARDEVMASARQLAKTALGALDVLEHGGTRPGTVAGLDADVDSSMLGMGSLQAAGDQRSPAPGRGEGLGHQRVQVLGNGHAGNAHDLIVEVPIGHHVRGRVMLPALELLESLGQGLPLLSGRLGCCHALHDRLDAAPQDQYRGLGGWWISIPTKPWPSPSATAGPGAVGN